MNKRLGEILKEIRLNKGISQNFVSNNIISQSNYSRFENGIIEISAESFILILERLDVDFEEFIQFYSNKNISARQGIIQNFNMLIYNNEESLKSLLNQINLYELSSEDIFIDNIRKVCISLIILENTHDFSKAQEGLDEVWNILSKRNQLYIADIYLLSSIIYYFPIDTARTIIVFIMKNLDNYNKIPKLEKVKLNLYINYSLLLIKNNLYSEALTIVNQSINYSKKIGEYLRLGISYFRKGLLIQIMGNTEEGNYWKMKGIKIISELEYYDIIKELEKEIDLYVPELN